MRAKSRARRARVSKIPPKPSSVATRALNLGGDNDDVMDHLTVAEMLKMRDCNVDETEEQGNEAIHVDGEVDSIVLETQNSCDIDGDNDKDTGPNTNEEVIIPKETPNSPSTLNPDTLETPETQNSCDIDGYNDKDAAPNTNEEVIISKENPKSMNSPSTLIRDTLETPETQNSCDIDGYRDKDAAPNTNEEVITPKENPKSMKSPSTLNRDTLETPETQNSCDIDGYNDKDAAPNTNEEVIIPMENPKSMNSQSTLNWDSLEMPYWTEQGICIKCNKGDNEVLICKGDGCPSVIHTCCLGCPPTFDDAGNFYCPLCSYKLVVSELEEAVKEVAVAKEKVHSARKSLSRFLGGSNKKESTERISERELNQSRMDVDCNCVCTNKQSCDGLPEDQQEARTATECGNGNLGKETYLASERNDILLTRDGENENQVGNHKRKSMEDQQEAVDSVHAEWLTQIPPLRPRVVDRVMKSCSKISIDMKETAFNKSARSNSASVNSRPKRLDWTHEEEEMLREGVKIVSRKTKQIPWRDILEFGREVFDVSRTPAGLKHKWRNMTEGSSRARKK